MKEQNLNRRDFLRLSGLASAGVMLAAVRPPPPLLVKQVRQQ